MGAEQLLGSPGSAAPSIQRCLSLAAIALAAEQVGGAQQCLDVAVEYAKTRSQFGRPIGSFQAIQHTCANMSKLKKAGYKEAFLSIEESMEKFVTWHRNNR